MAQKWHIVLLGMVICSGFKLSAMESEKKPGSRRNSLACSQEVQKEGAMLLAALSNSAGSRASAKKPNLYYPYPGGAPIDFNSHASNGNYDLSGSLKPYYPGH